MDSHLSPGVSYLVELIPRLAAPPATVFLLLNVFLKDFCHIALPWFITAPAYPLSVVFALLASGYLKKFQAARRAAAQGAVLPPSVRSTWPGGLGLDLLATGLKSLRNDYLGTHFAQWGVEYGHTFLFTVMGEPRIFTTEPHHIKAILASDFSNWEKGPVAKVQNGSLLGDGVFNADGELWKFHRSMTRPFFSRDRISHFDLFDTHATDALSQMRQRLREGCAVDFQDLMLRFTMDCATEFLFGKDVCSLSAGLPYPPSSPQARLESTVRHPADAFAHAFAEAQHVLMLRGRSGKSWPLAELWGDKCTPQMKTLREFVDPLLQTAIQKRAEKKAIGAATSGATEKESAVEEGDVLLDHLVNQTEDINILRDETLNMMVAGRDTTASTVTYAVYMLAEHPHILRRLREEIISALGQRRPTYEDLRNLKYLRAVINETLRLFPIVPLNGRSSIQDSVWSTQPGAKPLFIPGGTRALYSVLLMHRRKDLWGPDALEFDPDRFLDSRVSRLTQNPFIFLPFNAGPRICLGQQFAYNESSFILIRLLQMFSDIELALDVQPAPPAQWKSPIYAAGQEVDMRQKVEKVTPKSHLTLYIDGGLWVRMKEAVTTDA